MKERKDQVSERSPFAGCLILVVALGVMGFLVFFSVSSLFRQFEEIEKFTDDEPGVVEVVGEGEFMEERQELGRKLAEFEEVLGDEELTVGLELDVDELNLAIAGYSHFEELRGTLWVESITPEAMHLSISFPLNGKPRIAREGEGGWITSDQRYLNGVLVVVPELQGGEVVLRVEEIRVPGREVPEGFLGQFSPYRIFERYVGEGGIGEAMAGLTGVELGDGYVRLVREAGVVPADTLSDADVERAGNRLLTVLGVVAVLFLMLAGVLLFVGMRIQKRREAEGGGR